MEKTRRVIRISKRGIIVFLVIIIIVGIILLAFRLFRPHEIINYGLSQTTEINQQKSLNDAMRYPDYYPLPYQNNPSINDTREFLKTSYNAEIKTRNVENLISDIKNTIRDANGRVDSSNENPKNGYVSFVIPKSNFENFKNEIESITNKKLITEGVSSENLLSQKQNIEEQNKIATASLLALQTEQKNLIARHNQTLIDLQNNTKDTTLLLQNISLENSSFNAKNQNLKNQISNVKAQLANIAQQDSNFNNNIETVNGSISVQRISLWQLVKIFSPVSPVIIIIVLVIIFWFILRKKSYIPIFEFI